jgi:hypothetical protein
MKPLPLPRFDPAPSFQATDGEGLPVALRDYRHRHDLLLVMLHGPNCPHCADLLREMNDHRQDWEAWETSLLVLLSEAGAAEATPFRIGYDPDGAIRSRFAGDLNADGVVSVVDHRGRFMEGWSFVHPEPVDWHEVAETVRWVAVQEPECGACEVLPGWDTS